MMRALGFNKNHILVFVVLQALTFSIPGVLLGLMISFIINDAFREVMFVIMQNSTEYGMPTHVVLLSLFLFGLLLPIVAIIGPTQLALDKNLRVSLDASRRNGSDESTTATV